MSDRIDRDVINALIAGHFADPFSVLGMHKTTAGLEVRALLPDATDVWVIEPKTGRKLAKLECLDSRGFFSGVIPRRKNFFRYQLAVVWHGQQNLIDDPYRFGPLIQEMDAWLLSEGTHLRPYETLGAHARYYGWRHRYAFFCLGSKRPSGLGGWAIQLLGRSPSSDAPA